MGYKHRYLWLGSYQSDEQFQKMLARNIGQASGFASQKGLIKGFDQILAEDCDLDTIGIISYPPYPIYPRKTVEEENWSRTGISRDKIVGYLNIKYFTYLFRSESLYASIKTWGMERAIQDHTTVIIYEPSVSKLRAALFLKRRYGAKVFVIIPDVPELVNLGANKLIKAGKAIAAKQMRGMFSSVDGFILYSACMADYYGFKPDQWILMEGVFDPDEMTSIYVDAAKEERATRVMYCGALDEFRGIPQLLDAFEQLRERDYELWLTGAGSSESLIKERIKKDDRIKYFGYLVSRNDVLALEQKADILIHTRDLNSPAAPYCFPSKVFEYLATGKPVLSVDIAGIPEQYFNYMYKLDSLSVEDILSGIRSVTDAPKNVQNVRGQKGREFVLKEKTSCVQARKILDFIAEKCN